MLVVIISIIFSLFPWVNSSVSQDVNDRPSDKQAFLRGGREAKEEEGCQGGHKHCRKGIPFCGSRDPLPASQTAGSRATEETGQNLIHTERDKKTH